MCTSVPFKILVRQGNKLILLVILSSLRQRPRACADMATIHERQ